MARAVGDVTGNRPRNHKRNLISYQATTRLTPFLYVTPATLLFCLLMLFPMVMVIRYSLMDGAIVKKNASFAGLQNYREVFADPVFWESVGNTLYFTVTSVIFHLLLGLAFALLLNSPRVNPALRSILRVLFILPWLDTARVRSAKFRPTFRKFFWLLVIDCFVLGYVGANPPEGWFILAGRLATAYYFFHFLILLPLLGLFETPRPRPASIADSVLGAGGGAQPAGSAAAPETRG